VGQCCDIRALAFPFPLCKKSGMKIPSLLLALFSAATLPLHAEVSPVNMSVELVNNKTTPKGSGKTLDQHDKTQSRSLKITLNNGSPTAFDGLVVKYWFIGHDEGSHDSKVITAGERKSTLAPRGKDVIESEQATAHYVEAHYPPSKGGKGGGGAAAKIPASGEKITGHAVRVMQDAKVLAEYYSEPSLKEIVEKGGTPAPKPAAGAKPAAPAAKPGAKPAAKK
jgi:hypothetical protein